MNQLAPLAYSHSHAYNSGWTDWIARRVVSGVIYGAVFKMMRQMTTGEGNRAGRRGDWGRCSCGRGRGTVIGLRAAERALAADLSRM